MSKKPQNNTVLINYLTKYIAPHEVFKKSKREDLTGVFHNKKINENIINKVVEDLKDRLDDKAIKLLINELNKNGYPNIKKSLNKNKDLKIIAELWTKELSDISLSGHRVQEKNLSSKDRYYYSRLSKLLRLTVSLLKAKKFSETSLRKIINEIKGIRDDKKITNDKRLIITNFLIDNWR